MNLSPHFTLEELTVTTHRDIDNIPNDEAISNLRLLCTYLEKLRELLGCPILISSGYRCPDLNTLIGGSRNSRHMLGLAADFIAPKFGNPLEVCKYIVACPKIEFDQLIYERTWVHFGIAPQSNRKEVLTFLGKNNYAKGLIAP